MSFNWLSDKVQTQESPIEGLGTFASKDISKDELVVVFGGYAICSEEWDKLPQEVLNLGLPVNDNVILGVVTAEQKGDGDYINHSCAPNTGLRGQVLLVAMREISIGEEITFDYATCMAEKNGMYLDTCLCGTNKCRDVVSPKDWLLPEIQKKYRGYFSTYIQEKIDTLHTN